MEKIKEWKIENSTSLKTYGYMEIDPHALCGVIFFDGAESMIFCQVGCCCFALIDLLSGNRIHDPIQGEVKCSCGKGKAHTPLNEIVAVMAIESGEIRQVARNIEEYMSK